MHASDQAGVVTLCGLATKDLFEFGRSRFPFEREPTSMRCPTCDELAGHPQWADGD